MGPELITAIGGAIAAAATAFFGGKNSLNGFKAETRAFFISLNERSERIETKVDGLIVSDALQNEKLSQEDERLKALEERAEKPEMTPEPEEAH